MLNPTLFWGRGRRCSYENYLTSLCRCCLQRTNNKIQGNSIRWCHHSPKYIYIIYKLPEIHIYGATTPRNSIRLPLISVYHHKFMQTTLMLYSYTVLDNKIKQNANTTNYPKSALGNTFLLLWIRDQHWAIIN
jgi:hypothetical protein